MKLLRYIKDQFYLFLAFFLVLILFNIIVLTDVSIANAIDSLLYANTIAILSFLTLAYFGGYRKAVKQEKQLQAFIQEKDRSEIPKSVIYQMINEKDKEYQQEVQNLARELSEINDFMTNWIHQVKIPISVLEIISDRISEMEHGHPISKEINLELDRITVLVEQALYIARSGNYSSDFMIEELHLGNIVKDVIRKNKNIFIYNKIEIEIGNLDYTILSDKKWIKHIIEQIIHNACKYTDDKQNKRIEIFLEVDAKSCKLYIKDNGIGISTGDLNRVFDKGFTGENGRSRTKSTGMGLYIAKKIINRLDHDIHIISKKGEGTEVILTFYTLSDYFDVTKM